jgi:hypothetical protein
MRLWLILINMLYAVISIVCRIGFTTGLGVLTVSSEFVAQRTGHLVLATGQDIQAAADV